MKITFTWTPTGAAAATNFVAADSPANVPMTGLTFQGTRLMQVDNIIRATAPLFRNRGNRKTEVSWNTTRLWPDSVTAEGYALLYETLLPPDGVEFAVSFYASLVGAGAVTRYLYVAEIQDVTSKVIGCTTFHTHRIVGGVMQSAPP